MRLPLVRVTVRRMMLAVAIVAMTLEGSIVWNRYTYCHNRAATLTAQVAYLRGFAAKAPSPKAVIRGFVIELRPGTPPVPATGETIREWTAYLEALAQKAERESRRPWLPVEPDPLYAK
jgi:hypothetical protein